MLFVDLVGFTPLSEGRDPEEVRELLSRYFEVARTVVGRYGGTVEKFIGDAVMAVWGTPVALEGDVERAVRAGLDLVAAVAVLGAEVGAAGLAARAGVVTGEVAVTLGATGEGMVAGDAVNTAARVQSAATSGTVLVDGASRRAAMTSIGFDDAGEHVLKGKAEPQQLWRATRVLSGVGGSQRVDGLEAPLIGRDPELRLVKELFHAAVDRRLPRMVVVSGLAGVGKSRLGWEFEKYVDGLAGTVFWHRGRCLTYGNGVVFWALAEIVRQRLSIAEDDATAVAGRKLSEFLDGLIDDPPERSYVGQRVARLLGVPFAGDTGVELAREELFAGWRMFFERLAASAPVVCLIEDIHQADVGLLDFLDHLIDWTRGLPIFVLAFTRPELESERPGFGVGRNRTALTLDPLDRASMDSLVGALVPGMPAGARGAISDQAEGIPLFAVETIRSLIDVDIVTPVDGVYRLTGDLGTLSVPDSLHGLLASRLDALPPEVRMLVADAAVLGSTFPAHALVAVSGRQENDVRAGLAELLKREVLDVTADPLSPERGSYRFTQEMLRQVAYDTLSRRDRKARHLAVASHLRAAFADDGEAVIDVIARHYQDAVDAVPDASDLSELRSQTAAVLIRTAERSERTGAPRKAAESYAAAAKLGAVDGGLSSVAGLWEAAAKAEGNDGTDPEREVALWEKARLAYSEAGQARAAARAQSGQGMAMTYVGLRREGLSEMQAALEALREDPDRDTVIAMKNLGQVCALSGDPGADAITSEVASLCQSIGADAKTVGGVFAARGLALRTSGRLQEAAMYFRESGRMFKSVDDFGSAGVAFVNLSDALSGLDSTASRDAALEALSYLAHRGERLASAFATANVLSADLSLGEWDEAARIHAEAIEGQGLGDVEYLVLTRAWLVALRGDGNEADIILGGLPEMLATDDVQDRGSVELCRALIGYALQDPETALRHALIAVELGSAIGFDHEVARWAWPLAARCAYDLNQVATMSDLLAILASRPDGHIPPVLRAERDLVRAWLAADGDELDAEQLLDAAVTQLRTLSTPYHLAHGLLDFASLSNADEAANVAAVEEAVAIATRLGCRPILERAAQVRTSRAAVS